MPRAHRERQPDNFPRSKYSRGGFLRTTPPAVQDGRVDTHSLQPRRFESTNSTTTTPTPVAGTASFTPLLLGAGVASGSTLQEGPPTLVDRISEGNAFANSSSQNTTATVNEPAASSLSPVLRGSAEANTALRESTAMNNSPSLQNTHNDDKTLTKTILTGNIKSQSTNSMNDQNPGSNLLNPVSNSTNGDQGIVFNNQGLARGNSLSSLFTQWTKQNDGLQVVDVSMSVPSWMQNYEKYGLTKAAAAVQALAGGAQYDSDDQKTKHLREELTREKASNILLDQLCEEQRQQCHAKQQELEETLSENHDLERRLEDAQHRITELESTLVTAQQALETHHNSSEATDWVLERQEIQLTDKIIGIGGWGKVVEGKFRGMIVAVKQIHELILSPHNRRLFEREMNIAARCRHPCLLQFIGATNDNNSPLFVTELLDTSLRKVLQDRELEPNEVTTISLDVARALNYLHLNHPTPIIHRDISSANVLLWKHRDSWRAKVSDYGTANFMHYSMTISPGAVVYSAPEAQTSRQSPKVDVYSFGVLLCEMNTREFPDAMCRTEQVTMVTNHDFRDLIRRCLLEDPQERPSMNDIINEL